MMSCIKVRGLPNDPPRSMEISENLPDVSSKNKELIMSANKVFGKSWSHAVTNTTIDFIDSNMGKYNVGCQATVKVQLSNGIYHEDIGYSNVEAFSKGLAVENARLASATNALIKVLSCFTEMEAEMLKFTSSQETITNISTVVKTKFPLKRPKTPPPAAQSSPKIAKNPVTLVGIQGKKTNTTSVPSNGLAPESNEIDIAEVVDLHIFEGPSEMPGPSLLNIPTSSSTASSATGLTEEEIRLERKRKQREKQEEFKRQMKEKEEREKQNLRQDAQRPNAKF